MSAGNPCEFGECPGHCCRTITLSARAEKIAVMAAQHRAQIIYHPDAQFVVDHFIPMRTSYVDGITGRRWPAKRPRWQYRCDVWDGRKCTQYDDRPDFCRRYGSESACDVPGCTLTYRDEIGRWADDGGACRSSGQ